jgi:hypothetical protein
MIRDYPEEINEQTTPTRRVGGFYESLDEIEKAAEMLDFDVLVPPRSDQGWYMVPAIARELYCNQCDSWSPADEWEDGDVEVDGEIVECYVECSRCGHHHPSLDPHSRTIQK